MRRRHRAPTLQPWQLRIVERLADPDFKMPTLQQMISADRRPRKRFVASMQTLRALLRGEGL